MAKLKIVKGGWQFNCPHCGIIHTISKNDYSVGGTPDAPIVNPLITTESCHCMIANGNITYFSGMWIPLTDVP